VAERGAAPALSDRRRRALTLVSSFTSPLLPDDYLELVNPLWSTRELRGRVQRVQRETASTVTVWIKPGWRWPGHLPGQYLRIGVEVAGVLQWRAYSLTSAPGRADGCIAITPKLVVGGKVSPYLCRELRPGTIVRLGGVEGTFALNTPTPRQLLMVSAGSGITPIASMLRALAAAAEGIEDVVHIHSARTREEVIFGRELRALAANSSGYRLHEQITSERGRIAPQQLDALCPDWRERESYVCGPAGMLEALEQHWRAEGAIERLHLEHFQPYVTVAEHSAGEGGAVSFRASDVEANGKGGQPILDIGEQSGVALPYGCRMGICHSCVGRLRSGRVRDLRTGGVHGEPGEMVRTCVNAPEGAIEIDL
jgi:ferredoxin-NADP reductase